MSAAEENERGPSFGEPAPDFEAIIAGQTIRLRDFRGKWVVIFTHPGDLLSVFKTRTIKYLLCKRRTKVIALGDGQTEGIDTGRNLLKKYILKHNLMIVDDSAGGIARSYGLPGPGNEPQGEKGVFIVDPGGILRVKLYLPLASDRSFYEVLKLIDVLQAADKQKALRTGKKTLRRQLGMVIRSGTASEEGQTG